eukprot:SAG31_NODE_3186_length_4575_cov_2.905496_3_plen_212_part_00
MPPIAWQVWAAGNQAASTLWLFGGSGAASDDSRPEIGLLSDLWRYDGLNSWDWVGGSDRTNQVGIYTPQPGQTTGDTLWPGARQFAAVWSAGHGRAWIFGGEGIDSKGSAGYLSDLWYFDATVVGAAVDGAAGGWLYLGGSSHAFGGGWLSTAWPRPRVGAVVWVVQQHAYGGTNTVHVFSGQINQAGWRLGKGHDHVLLFVVRNNLLHAL